MSSFHQRICIGLIVFVTTATMLDKVSAEIFVRPSTEHGNANKTKSQHFWTALEKFLDQYDLSRSTEIPETEDHDRQDDNVGQFPTTAAIRNGNDAAEKWPNDDMGLLMDNLLDMPSNKDETGDGMLSQKFSHHPYMQTIYEEIEENRHQKWSDIEANPAKIRGIEPFNIIHEQGQGAAILEFTTETLHSLKHIRHVDLILSADSKHPRMTSDTFEVRPLTSQSHNIRHPPVARLSSYKWLKTSQNQFYLVLELAPYVWHGWNQTFFKTNEMLALRLSRSGHYDLPLQRPLLVLYYTVSPAEQTKDMERFSLSNTLERVRRRIHVSTPPRLCKNCALATRKNLILPPGEILENSCSLHQWFVTLPELGWDNWVVAPYEFYVNYCSGPCQPPIFSWINTTYNAVVRSIIANRTSKSALPSWKAKNIPPPYCVPTQLKPINTIYNDNGTAVINRLENIVAQECGCS